MDSAPSPFAHSTPEAEDGPRPAAWRDRRWVGLLLAGLLVAVAVAVARPWDDGDGEGFGLVAQVPAPTHEELATAPEVGKLAPNFRLRTADGGELRLSDLRGRPVFLNFWATWCFSCLTEMPAMQKLADRHGEAVAVLGVNVGEDPETARTFATNFEIRYPLALDAETAVARAYGVRAMPTSLFLDAQGVVRSVTYGVLTPPQMEERLADVLPGRPDDA